MTKLTGEEIRAPLAEPPYPRPSYLAISPRGEYLCTKCGLPCDTSTGVMSLCCNAPAVKPRGTS